jgi:hypothetical protein
MYLPIFPEQMSTRIRYVESNTNVIWRNSRFYDKFLGSLYVHILFFYINEIIPAVASQNIVALFDPIPKRGGIIFFSLNCLSLLF